jgi:hypothetical protein
MTTAGGTKATMASARATDDQAHLPLFKATLVAQAAAGLVFGLAPLLVQAGYAQALGFSGEDQLIYRLGGAATTGYFVAPLVALAWRVGWAEIRIPAIATLTFTIGALGASVWEFLAGARQLVVPFVVVAGAVFTAIALYWIRRDEGVEVDAGRPVRPVGRVILALATLSAAVFGIIPLLAPAPFASLFGLSGTDSWVFRLAGAGCLGYATAGVASLMAPGYRLMRIQNLAAITFNLLAAIGAWLAVAGGYGGLLAPVVAAAASFFTIALIWMDRQLSS